MDRLPTEAELRRLFQAAEPHPPTKVKLLGLVTVATETPSASELDKLREILKESRAGYPQQNGTTTEETLKQIDERERQAIESDLREHSKGRRFYLDQEWISGRRYRLDQAFSTETLDAVKPPRAFDRTVVVSGDLSKGDHSNHEYTYGAMAASFDNRPGTAIQPAGLFHEGVFHPIQRLAIRSLLGDGGPSPDLKEIERLSKGTSSRFSVRITERELEGTSIHQFTVLKAHDNDSGSSVEYWVDSRDYRKCYRSVTKSSHVITQLMERRGFREDGFPRWMRKTEERNGRRKTIEIEYLDVDLNAEFDDHETFGFAPPEEFSITDRTSGSPKLVRTVMINGERLPMPAVVVSPTAAPLPPSRNSNHTALLVFVAVNLALLAFIYWKGKTARV